MRAGIVRAEVRCSMSYVMTITTSANTRSISWAVVWLLLLAERILAPSGGEAPLQLVFRCLPLARPPNPQRVNQR